MDSTTGRTARRAALRWLVHPVTCAALVVLLVNDHRLKLAYGTWWTGKLSDVAGLVVAPPLLAVLVTVACGRRAPRPGRLVVGSGLAVALGFAVVKTTAAGAALATAVWTALAGPSLVRADATDLLTLPAAAVAVAVGVREARRAADHAGPSRVPPRWVVVLPVAVLVTVATSTTGPDGAEDVGVVDGRVVVTLSDGGAMVTDDLARWRPAEDLDLVPRPDTGAPPPADCTDDGATCFRPAGQGVGVQRSDDGGRTWADEWSLPPWQSEVLRRRSGEDVASLATSAVAVLPGADGSYRVVAANGVDGIAVREADGTWERRGVPSEGGATVAPLPDRSAKPGYPLPEGLVAGVLAFTAVLVTGEPYPRRRRPDPPPARGLGLACLGVGTVLLLQVTLAAYDGGRTGFVVPFVPTLVAAAAALVGVLGLGRVAYDGGGARAIGPAAAAGVLVAVGWSAAPSRWLGLAAAVAAVAVSAPVVRLLTRRAGTPAPSSPQPPRGDTSP